MNFAAFKRWVLDRAQEPSTWRGLVLIATGVCGYTLPAGLTIEHVVSGGLALAGAIGALSADKKSEQN